MTAKQKMFKATADTLRGARDLMNHGGKHWIKGGEKGWVNSSHVPGALHVYGYEMPGYEEVAYCSVGALREKTAAREAYIALANVIDLNRMKAAQANWERWAAEAIAAGEHFDVEEYIYEGLYETANDVIISFNDAKKTTWADVRSAFNKAAKRAADRARA